MSAEPRRLICSIVKDEYVLNGTSRNVTYVVKTEDGEEVAKAVSSSYSWVRHDAGGYHTQEKFDELFPEGWFVAFEFGEDPIKARPL